MPLRKSFAAGINLSVFVPNCSRSESSGLGKIPKRSLIASIEWVFCFAAVCREEQAGCRAPCKRLLRLNHPVEAEVEDCCVGIHNAKPAIASHRRSDRKPFHQGWSRLESHNLIVGPLGKAFRHFRLSGAQMLEIWPVDLRPTQTAQ